MRQNLDSMMDMVEEKCGPKGLVSWYLMASLLYYHADIPLLSDERYDRVCKTLLAGIDVASTHMHGHLLDRDALAAGTGHHLKLEEFPYITRSAALRMAEEVATLTDETRERIYHAPLVQRVAPAPPPKTFAVRQRTRPTQDNA